MSAAPLTASASVAQWILLPVTLAYGRGIMSSDGAAIAALAGREKRSDNEAEEYSVVLPPLPTGSVVLNTVFLHGDVRARPYRVEDFRDALMHDGVLADVAALGTYLGSYV